MKKIPIVKILVRAIFSLFLILLTLAFCLSQPTEAYDYQSVALLNQRYQTFLNYQFIRKIAPLAQAEQANSGLLPSLTLAQACLESDFGQSLLASKYHNLFGVKAYDDTPMVSLSTKEYVNKKWITIKGDFQVYSSWQESVSAHTQLFVNGVTWDPAHYHNVLTARTYQEAAHAVQADGYATDPNYATKLIKVVETYQLYQYD